MNSIYLNEGLTENQIYNIKVYTTRALNLVLDAKKALKKKKIIRKEIYTYLDGALFFLNVAGQYSPSYLVRRQIEATMKLIELFPSEDYTNQVKGINISLQEIAANLDEENREYVLKEITSAIQNASLRRNKLVYESLKRIKYLVKINTIDDPIDEAKKFIAIAKDHVKAKQYFKGDKSLELAISPLERIAYRENLYIALAKEYIYKAYLAYYRDINITKRYLISAVYAISKAYYVASVDTRGEIAVARDKLFQLAALLEKYQDLIRKEGEKFKNRPEGQEIERLFKEIFDALNSIQ
jgi:hypothetical protein